MSSFDDFLNAALVLWFWFQGCLIRLQTLERSVMDTDVSFQKKVEVVQQEKCETPANVSNEVRIAVVSVFAHDEQ